MSEHRHTVGRVDATSPWVIDIRELGRRPGSMRRYLRRILAPPGFGLEVVGVSAGAEIALDVRLESVVEGVLASGTVSAAVSGECARCLDEVHDEVAVELTELFAYPDSATEDTTEADEVSHVVDDMVDLGPAARDAVLLALPSAPLCAPDCRGLCPECGEKWADLPVGHRHETMDPRWAALQEKFGLQERFGGGSST